MFTMDECFKTLAIQKAKGGMEEDTKYKEQGRGKLLVLLFIWNKH